MEGFTVLPHQAAGHPGVFMDTSEGNLFAKLTTDQEIDFYTAIYAQEVHKDEDLVGNRLSDWMPRFIGRLNAGITKELEENGAVNPQELENAKKQLESIGEAHVPQDKPFVVLENVLYGFEKPSLIDIKLGSVLTDGQTTEEKRQRLAKVAKTTTSGSLGFRICGMKCLQNDKESVMQNYDDILASDQQVVAFDAETGYAAYNKHFGRNLASSNVVKAFKLFFCENQLTIDQQRIVLEKTIQRLQLLYNCLLDTEIRMFSSSLLIIFENDQGRWHLADKETKEMLVRDDFETDSESDEECDNQRPPRKCAPLSSLNLIDFAHSTITPGMGPDNNVLDGVLSLLDVFEKLVNLLE